jgi:membrane-bound serine protease (ClpP class)
MLAAEAVQESRAFTEMEALEASPPLIDFTAADVNEILRTLDGRSIKRFDGRSTIVRTEGAETRRLDMTRRQQFLSAIANPEIAYLLMTLGMIGLTVELWNPGAVLPGVAGALSLLLAFFALQVLSINTTGVLLVLPRHRSARTGTETAERRPWHRGNNRARHRLNHDDR